MSGLMTPMKSFRQYMTGMIDNFGLEFVIMMASAYFGVKGALYSFNGLVLLPYYKSRGVSGRDYQIYGTIGVAPFSMKALIGAVSDSVPLFGWNKASYIMGSAVLGSLSYVVLGSANLTAKASAGFFFLVNVELALVDLLCEGKYAEKMRNKPETGSSMVTWVWATYHAGSLLAALVTGPIADSMDVSVVFWICLPLAAQVALPVARGYLQDERLPEGDRGVRWDKIKEHPRMFLIAVCMAAGAMGQAVINLAMTGNPGAQLAYSLIVSAILASMAFWALPRTLAMANLFLFVDSMVYIQIGGALDYWFTASNECVPGGPSFSFTYYTTFTRIVGALAAGLGVVMFQSIMGEWRIRKIFWTTTLMRCIAGIFDIVMVTRANVAMGISDKVFYMLGDAIIFEVAYMMNFMPCVVLISKLCPKDVESTTYALLAGFSNFGQQVSRTLGVFFINAFDIRTEVPCKFDGLSEIIAWCHVLIPLVMIPLSFILIPDASLKDDMASNLFARPHAAHETEMEENGTTSLSAMDALSEVEDNTCQNLVEKDSEPQTPAEASSAQPDDDRNALLHRRTVAVV